MTEHTASRLRRLASPRRAAAPVRGGRRAAALLLRLGCAALLAWPRPLAGLLAAGYTAATLGALLISLGVGLFGFRESISASYVTQSLAIETITVLALLGWSVLVAAIPVGRAARARPLDGSPTGAADEIAGSRRP